MSTNVLNAGAAEGGSVNLGSGNLWVQSSQVAGGSFSPVPQLAYNAASAQASPMASRLMPCGG